MLIENGSFHFSILKQPFIVKTLRFKNAKIYKYTKNAAQAETRKERQLFL